MNLEWFNAFLEASRQKSLSKASEKIKISQPALSKQIRSLEEGLGVQLFKRSSIGVELTEAGALLYERIQPILAEMESLQQDLVNLNKITSIRLGTLPSLASYYLPQHVIKLNEQGIRIEMHVLSTTGEIIALLQNGSLDAGIVQKPSVLPHSLWSSDLFHEPYYAVVPQTHAHFNKNLVTLNDLKNEALIVYPKQCDVRTSITEAYEARGYDPNFSIEVAFGESIPGFVAAGAGITIVPEIIAKHLSHSSLKAIPISDYSKSRTISLISPKPSVGKRLSRYF